MYIRYDVLCGNSVNTVQKAPQVRSNNNVRSVAVRQRPQLMKLLSAHIFLVVGAGHAQCQLSSTRAPADSV